MSLSHAVSTPSIQRAITAASACALVGLAAVLAIDKPLLVPLAVGPALLLTLSLRDRSRERGLDVAEMERLRRAEVALAEAPTPQAAARELAEHAIALLGARSAVVIIEGLGDTVRVAVGDLPDKVSPNGPGWDMIDGSVYSAGSRMRLIEDNGTPCGSIAVSARRDSRPYDERDERVLDALAQRVSSTLHRLSLFDAVRSEQRTLGDILSSSSDGIVAVGSDLQVRSWNPAMVRITGVPEERAVGQHCCSVFRPRSETGEPCYGAGCPGRTGRPVEDLLVQIDAGGATKWLNCAFSPLSGGGYVLVARDVTVRKQVEDEKADFLATVSHELRTPLTPIKGFLQTLLRRDGEFEPEDRRHIYEVMLREEARLERLVHQLLQATSLESAERTATAVSVDWTPLAADQVARFARQDPSREISLTIEGEIPKVLADPHLAQEVLGNILSNAIKYSPDGAPVRVVVERDGVSVVTTVIDAGDGIPMADRERIFGRFTRLGDHLTRAQPGVGLGLYIARRSVEAMGGRIWVIGGESGGSEFSFTLPVARPEPAAGPGVRRPALPVSRS